MYPFGYAAPCKYFFLYLDIVDLSTESIETPFYLYSFEYFFVATKISVLPRACQFR